MPGCRGARRRVDRRLRRHARTAHFLPGLTTVRQDLESLGRQCIEILLRALAGDRLTPDPIAPTLVVRESTKRPPGRLAAR